MSVSYAYLSPQEWERVISGLADLRNQDLRVSSTGSVGALASVAKASQAADLLIHEADRFGLPAKFVPELARLAASSGLALIATTGLLAELPDWAREGVTCVNGQVEVSVGGHEKSPPLDGLSGGRGRGAGSSRAGLFHAVGLALGGDDDGVVEEPVEKADCGGVLG